MTAPLLREYVVGIVVPQAGLNAGQLAEVTLRVRQAAALLPEDGCLHLIVPGFDKEPPDSGVQPEVRNLARIHKVKLTFEGVRSRDGNSAGIILMLMDSKHRADEVWCCFDNGSNTLARANRVYRMAQNGARAVKYKKIPPWVEAPAPNTPAKVKTQPKKEQRLW